MFITQWHLTLMTYGILFVTISYIHFCVLFLSASIQPFSHIRKYSSETFYRLCTSMNKHSTVCFILPAVGSVEPAPPFPVLNSVVKTLVGKPYLVMASFSQLGPLECDCWSRQECLFSFRVQHLGQLSHWVVCQFPKKARCQKLQCLTECPLVDLLPPGEVPTACSRAGFSSLPLYL